MAEVGVSTVSCAANLAECTVKPVLRPFGYLIKYKSNVENLTEKFRTLTARRDGVQLLVDAAKRNSEDILPEVHNWLERVNQTVRDKETWFEEGRVAKATTCCSSNGWCPNLKVRYSLSRKAKRMVPKVDQLLTDGNFSIISCPAPPRKIDYPAKPHKEASSSGTSNPAKHGFRFHISACLSFR